MDALRNGLDTILSVIASIETSHGSEQCLSGTDVRCSLFALDMLFTSLQSHTVAKLAVLVLRKTDDTTRHVTLELIASSEVSGRRTTVEHWDTQTLSATEYNVSTPFTWRNEHRKREDICINGYLAISGMSLFHEFAVVFYATVRVRILDDATEDFRSKFQSLVIAHKDSHALRNHACTDNGQVLWEDVFVHEEHVSTCLLLGTATELVHHVSGFGGGGSFVQKRAVGKRHGGQVGYCGLEVQQSFQTSLRYFSLIRSIRSIPHRIFEYITLDHGRTNGVIPTHTYIRSIEFVLRCQISYMFRKLAFGHRSTQCQRFLQTDIGRDGLVDKFVHTTHTDFFKHNRKVRFLNTVMTVGQ